MKTRIPTKENVGIRAEHRSYGHIVEGFSASTQSPDPGGLVEALGQVLYDYKDHENRVYWNQLFYGLFTYYRKVEKDLGERIIDRSDSIGPFEHSAQQIIEVQKYLTQSYRLNTSTSDGVNDYLLALRATSDIRESDQRKLVLASLMQESNEKLRDSMVGSLDLKKWNERVYRDSNDPESCAFSSGVDDCIKAVTKFGYVGKELAIQLLEKTYDGYKKIAHELHEELRSREETNFQEKRALASSLNTVHQRATLVNYTISLLELR
jgi:hypothetical protein